jgi:hypothetical protein
VHDEPPFGAEQRRDRLRRGPQQQSYERRGSRRVVAALVLTGQEGEEDGGDRRDGVVARVAPR